MRRLNRRDFTRNALLTTVCAPFVNLVVNSGSAFAQTPRGTAKYLFIFYTNGTDPAIWTPTGSTENEIKFSPMTELLSPLVQDLVIVEQLSSGNTADGHGDAGGLTGKNFDDKNKDSLDVIVANGLAKLGIKTPVPNVILGGVPTQVPSAFYRNDRPILPISVPSVAFQSVFDVLPGAQNVELIQTRKKIVEAIAADYESLSRYLGTKEQAKLRLHTNSLAQLQNRLSLDPNEQQCQPTDVTNAEDAIRNSRVLVDVAVSAFACDLTRVASVQFGHHERAQINLPEVGRPGDWHYDLFHTEQPPRDRLVAMERWLCERFVEVANKLKAVPAPTGEGNLYDQTLLVWARNMGDAVIHNGDDMRFVFAGGAGGYLRTSDKGRYIRGQGVLHQRVLFNICEAMGLSDFTGLGKDTQRTSLPGISV